MKKDSDSAKQSSRRPSKEEIKKRLMDLLIYKESIDTEDLNERANIVESYEEGVDYIKGYKDIIKTNKKSIIFFAYQQDEVFRKFKENRKFKSLVEQFKITKGTIIFKMNIVKLVDKYPKTMTSSVTLNFLKKVITRILKAFTWKTRKILNKPELFSRVYF